MPVLINEVVAEMETPVPQSQAPTPEERMPMEQTAFELTYLLGVMEQRRQRLMVD